MPAKTIPNQPDSKMAQLLDKVGDLGILKPGDMVEGIVTAVTSSRIWVDINGGKFTGIISGRELAEAGIAMPDFKGGETILASVVDQENEEGFVILSIREALRNRGWNALEEQYQTGTMLTARVVEANRGGLIMEADGVRGFLPVSQLTPAHYPRVGNDKDEILSKLAKFEGQNLEVKIIGCDKEINKLIFSEKAAKQEEFDALTSKIQVGEVLTGRVSGVVDFGIFVNFGELEGLVHISEISWDKVEDPRSFAKVGDNLQVQVIGIEGDKISLSLKRLIEDKWLDLVKGYKPGDVVEGIVTQIMPFGVFVKVNDEIDGLIHISELSFEHVADPSDVVKAGDKLKLKVIDIEPESHRFGLSLKAMIAPESMPPAAKKSASSDLSKLGFSDALVRKLKEAGIDSVATLQSKTVEEIKAINGIGEKSAAKIMEALKNE
ncbi:TPA: 30S ribosomal protein S1 [Patescibacteria group bacterium]|uniref:RNA binding S1 domain protein n=1 Tax=candidate division Kazan bacterium GW2011_GWA1_44_22 TaxID=1620410 RepID=A0A0G1I124_UNCK3|nr:MAG: RNA binding S1 domain protein [candidate division Kazan bacterium GW2011_GWA1_44_22]HAR55036.1 30S ribosomal protein S1 [Patescibacteria group bacterium]